ncbi:unnamed protein product [Cochlearia groenlandica]
MSGLSFLQSMSDIRNREDTTYVHPIEKLSFSKLNEKSLEMCTESLGTETGSESGDDLSLLALEATTTPRVPSTNLQVKKPKTSRYNSFPPPIKFVKGSKYNRMVRSLGEDGRLVVQVISVSYPPDRCFVAERCEGRLRLSLSNESSLLSHNHEGEAEEGKSGNKMLSKLSRCRCKEINGREPKPMLTWKQHQFCVAT